MKKTDRKHQAILDTAYRLFRTQGFDGTSIAEITAEVGGSKATIYSHFPSKEELFAECMMAATENYMARMLKDLEAAQAEPRTRDALLKYGKSFLDLVCSAEQVEVRRVIYAEAARSGAGKLFAKKVAAARAHVAAFLSECMASGTLRRDDPNLAADYLRGLLEAGLVEPLLLEARDEYPNDRERTVAAERAVTTFLTAYAPVHSAGRRGRAARKQGQLRKRAAK